MCLFCRKEGTWGGGEYECCTQKNDRDFVNCVAVAQECHDDVAKFRLLSHVGFNLVKECLEEWEVLDFDGHVGLEVAIGHLPALQMLQLVPIRVRPPFNYTECNVPNAPHSAPSLPHPLRSLKRDAQGGAGGKGGGHILGHCIAFRVVGQLCIYVVFFVQMNRSEARHHFP